MPNAMASCTWGRWNSFQVMGPWGVPLGIQMEVVVLKTIGWPPR